MNTSYEVFKDCEDPFHQARMERIRKETQNMYKRQSITAIFGIVVTTIIIINPDDYKYVKVLFVFVLTILVIFADYKFSNIYEIDI
jgi:hypothetical protein